MSQKYYCPICGKPSRLYMGRPRKDMLCNIHADMVINGDIKLNSEGSYVKRNSMPLDKKIYILKISVYFVVKVVMIDYYVKIVLLSLLEWNKV